MSWLRPQVSALPDPVYPATVAQRVGAWRQPHLDESPLAPSPRAVEAMTAAAASGDRYPEIVPLPLTSAVAATAGFDANQILTGCGSDQLIDVVTRATREPGREAVSLRPTLPRIPAAAASPGPRIVEPPLDHTGAPDIPALLAACSSATRLIM